MQPLIKQYSVGGGGGGGGAGTVLKKSATRLIASSLKIDKKTVLTISTTSINDNYGKCRDPNPFDIGQLPFPIFF